MEYSERLEFPKKSNSKRRRIFKQRARGRVRELAKAFYDENNFSVPNTTVEAITAAILDDYVKMAKNPDFSSKVLHPEVRTHEALIDKIYDDVAKGAGRQSPTALLETSGR